MDCSQSKEEHQLFSHHLTEVRKYLLLLEESGGADFHKVVPGPQEGAQENWRSFSRALQSRYRGLSPVPGKRAGGEPEVAPSLLSAGKRGRPSFRDRRQP